MEDEGSLSARWCCSSLQLRDLHAVEQNRVLEFRAFSSLPQLAQWLRPNRPQLLEAQCPARRERFATTYQALIDVRDVELNALGHYDIHQPTHCNETYPY